MEEFYCGQIKRGQLTVDQVPARWRDAVAARLRSDEAEGRPKAEEQSVEAGRSWLSSLTRKK